MTGFSVSQTFAANRRSNPMRCSIIIFAAASCLLWVEAARAVEVPKNPPKALKETQDKEDVDQHEKAAQADVTKHVAPVVPPAWIEQIRDMATARSKRATSCRLRRRSATNC